jgi:hypothetical protein
MRIVIEIDNEAPVTQQSAVPAVESAPAVDGGAPPVTSASTTGALVALASDDVVDGGAAAGHADQRRHKHRRSVALGSDGRCRCRTRSAVLMM